MDEQELLYMHRQVEAQARKELEADGCPPCYPPGLDIPDLQSPPEECRAILAYWLWLSSTGHVPLSAQLRAWRRFRLFQQQTRRRFSDFERNLRQRRQTHGLDGPATALTADLTLQSPLERWIEFQDYHLTRLETMQRKRDRLEKELGPAPDTRRGGRHTIFVGRDQGRYTAAHDPTPLDGAKTTGHGLEPSCHIIQRRLDMLVSLAR